MITMHDVLTFGILLPIAVFFWFAIGYIIFLLIETLANNWRK